MTDPHTILPNTGVVVVNSAIGAEADLDARIGVDAATQLEVTSTLGVGPRGPQGEVGPQGPQGIQGVQGIQGLQGIPGENGTPIVLVAHDPWPPIAPVAGTLYLRSAV